MEKKLKPIPLNKTYRLLNHGPTVLISSSDGVKDNISAVSWIMPFNFDPFRLGAVIDRSHKTFDNIIKTGECIINIPVRKQKALVMKLGTTSGHEKDKTKGLKLFNGKTVTCKALEGCCAWIEARYINHQATDDFDLMIFDAVAAYAPADALTKQYCINVAKYPTLHYLTGKDFCTVKKI